MSEVISTTSQQHTNNGYAIKNVTVTSDGSGRLFFHIEWEGDDNMDFYELRILDGNKKFVESDCDLPHNAKMTIDKWMFNLKSGKVNALRFYIELGIPDYEDDGREKSWDLLACYGPIDLKVYYKFNFFSKNVLEIR